MRVLLHGFGTYCFVFRHLIERAAVEAPEIAWSIILPTEHHVATMAAVIPRERIFCLEHHQARSDALRLDLDALASYPGSIHADIDAEKCAFKHFPARIQLARAIETYTLYKDFVRKVAPSHILMAQIEGHEGQILGRLAHELGIRLLVPVSGRNLGGTFFSDNSGHTPPPHAAATPEALARAEAFVRAFREAPTSAAGRPADPSADGAVLPGFSPPLPVRLTAFLRRAVTRPDLFDREHLRTSLWQNNRWLMRSVRRRRRARAERIRDVDRLEQLPARFVYYPLHFTPEASINTPAPYFVDQLRAIDAIRYALPHDHLLVVKEHWSAAAVRPLGFVRSLQKRSGIVVAHVDLDSREIIKRAAATVSVTGSAAVEAFLFGRPALCFGPSLISGALGGPAPIDGFRERLAQAIAAPPEDGRVVAETARLLSVLHPFMFGPPGLPGEPVMRPANIARFLVALRAELAR